jgi:hypothetical protein
MPRETEGMFVELTSGDLEFGSALMQPVSTVATASDSKTAQIRFRNP